LDNHPAAGLHHPSRGLSRAATAEARAKFVEHYQGEIYGPGGPRGGQRPAGNLHDPFRGRDLDNVGKERLVPGVDSSEFVRGEDVRRGAIRFGAGHERLAPGVDSSEVLLEGSSKGYDALRRAAAKPADPRLRELARSGLSRLRETARLAGGIDRVRQAWAESPEGRAAVARQRARDEKDLAAHNAYMAKDDSDEAAEGEEAIRTARFPFSVDRIEKTRDGSLTAVLVGGDGGEITVPRGILADDVREGDVISKAFGVDEAGTADLKAVTRYIQEHPGKSAGSGDIKIK